MPLTTTITIVFLAFFLSLASPIALSQSCEPTDEVVRDLLKYAHIAERSEDRSGDEPCLSARTTLSYGSGDKSLTAYNPFTKLDFDHFKSRLEMVFDGQPVFVEQPKDPENTHTLYVGCEDEVINFDVAVEMRFYRPRGDSAEVIRLGMVYRDKNSGAQQSQTIYSNLEKIMVLPGAHGRSQRLASIKPEQCTFPAAKFAIYAMCEHAVTMKKEGTDRDSSSRMNNSMPIVVGHSLGGAAAQFIATSRQSEEEGIWPTCPGVHAYAFGSIGLKKESVMTNGEFVPTRGTLKTYVSKQDQVISSLSVLFSDNLQLGRIFTFPSDSHGIDEIQKDLCWCLKENVNCPLRYHGSPELPLSNKALYDLRELDYANNPPDTSACS